MSRPKSLAITPLKVSLRFLFFFCLLGGRPRVALRRVALQEDVRVARQGHAAVVHHGKVLVFGGVADGTVFMNDCLA